MSWESVLPQGPATDIDQQVGEGLTLEVLYPEVADLGGDGGNMMYLAACLPGATLHQTHLGDEPLFAHGRPDFVCLGNMNASDRRRVTRQLAPYAGRLVELADAGTLMLFSGSAAEVLGRDLQEEDGSTSQGLGVFPFDVRRHPIGDRINDLFVGPFEDFEVIGWKSQFTEAFGDNSDCYFSRGERGCGINLQTNLEGFRRGGLLATWLLGPLLPANPPLCRWLLAQLGLPGARLAFEDTAQRAYEVRLPEMRDPKRTAV